VLRPARDQNEGFFERLHIQLLVGGSLDGELEKVLPMERHVDPDTGIVSNPPLLPPNILTSLSYEPNASSLANRAHRNGWLH